MMQNMLIMLTLLTTMIFIQLYHPLAIGLTLLVQTLLVCLISSLMNETYWFSYILFLVFMGGMLVLFIYVTSLASNETFSLSINMMLIFMMLLMITYLFMLFYDLLIYNEFFSLNMSINNNKENFINLIKLFNYPTNLVTILLMNYLLITLIAVVKITNIFYGPLRQMFN